MFPFSAFYSNQFKKLVKSWPKAGRWMAGRDQAGANDLPACRLSEPMSREEDLHLQPTVYKTVALLLSYLGLGAGRQIKPML